MTKLQHLKNQYTMLMIKTQALDIQQKVYGFSLEKEEELDNLKIEIYEVGRKLDNLLMFDRSSIESVTNDLADQAILSVALNDSEL